MKGKKFMDSMAETASMFLSGMYQSGVDRTKSVMEGNLKNIIMNPKQEGFQIANKAFQAGYKASPYLTAGAIGLAGYEMIRD